MMLQVNGFLPDDPSSGLPASLPSLCDSPCLQVCFPPYWKPQPRISENIDLGFKGSFLCRIRGGNVQYPGIAPLPSAFDAF